MDRYDDDTSSSSSFFYSLPIGHTTALPVSPANIVTYHSNATKHNRRHRRPIRCHHRQRWWWLSFLLPTVSFLSIRYVTLWGFHIRMGHSMLTSRTGYRGCGCTTTTRRKKETFLREWNSRERWAVIKSHCHSAAPSSHFRRRRSVPPFTNYQDCHPRYKPLFGSTGGDGSSNNDSNSNKDRTFTELNVTSLGRRYSPSNNQTINNPFIVVRGEEVNAKNKNDENDDGDDDTTTTQRGFVVNWWEQDWDTLLTAWTAAILPSASRGGWERTIMTSLEQKGTELFQQLEVDNEEEEADDDEKRDVLLSHRRRRWWRWGGQQQQQQQWKESWKQQMEDLDVRDHVWRYILGDWDKIRNNQILITVFRAFAIAVLSWNFLSTLITLMSVGGVWMWQCWNDPSLIPTFAFGMSTTMATTTTPTHHHHHYQLLNSYEIVRWKLQPFLIPLNAIGTILILPYYENFVCTIERMYFTDKSKMEKPILYRLQALLLSFLIGYLGSIIALYMTLFMGTLVGLCKHRIVGWLFP